MWRRWKYCVRDRHLLAEDGIFIAVVTLDPKNRRIAAGPEIQSRGFVYVRESEELMQEAEDKVREIVKLDYKKNV